MVRERAVSLSWRRPATSPLPLAALSSFHFLKSPFPFSGFVHFNIASLSLCLSSFITMGRRRSPPGSPGRYSIPATSSRCSFLHKTCSFTSLWDQLLLGDSSIASKTRLFGLNCPSKYSNLSLTATKLPQTWRMSDCSVAVVVVLWDGCFNAHLFLCTEDLPWFLSSVLQEILVSSFWSPQWFWRSCWSFWLRWTRLILFQDRSRNCWKCWPANFSSC